MLRIHSAKGVFVNNYNNTGSLQSERFNTYVCLKYIHDLKYSWKGNSVSSSSLSQARRDEELLSASSVEKKNNRPATIDRGTFSSPPRCRQPLTGGIMLFGCRSIHLSHLCEHDISRTPWSNFFRFGTNIQLDSRTIYVRIQRSEVKGQYHYDFSKPPLPCETQTQRWTDKVLVVEGVGDLLFLWKWYIRHTYGISLHLAQTFSWTESELSNKLEVKGHCDLTNPFLCLHKNELREYHHIWHICSRWLMD